MLFMYSQEEGLTGPGKGSLQVSSLGEQYQVAGILGEEAVVASFPQAGQSLVTLMLAHTVTQTRSSPEPHIGNTVKDAVPYRIW